MSEETLSSEEIRLLRKLIEIEKIRKKKLLYSQLMDSDDPDGFANLYAEDAVAEWGPFGTWHGREAILEQSQYTRGKPEFNWFHMTTNLWIEMTGPDTATSRCYLHDICNAPVPNVSPTWQFGVYEEDWIKIDGEWFIKHHRIFFLWPIRYPGDKFSTKMTPTEIG